MPYKPRIILQTPLRADAPLAEFVEACLLDGVELIAVCGNGCEEIHDLLDALIIGDGSDDNRFIATSWHTNEPLGDVIEFASTYGEGGADAVEVVTL